MWRWRAKCALQARLPVRRIRQTSLFMKFDQSTSEFPKLRPSLPPTPPGEFPQLVNLTGCQSRIFRHWPKVICSHLSAAGFFTSKLLVNNLPHLWARSRQDHSAEFSAQCCWRNLCRSLNGKVRSASNRVFRSDSPIQYWLRQPAEKSVRWIVPLDTMSNVGEMISPRL